MEIFIENIGQIEKANIKLDGITIIAGENNTGKSTVGKTLFAVLRGMDDWNANYTKICIDRLHEKIRKLSIELEEFCLEKTTATRRRTNRANALVLELCNKKEFIIDIEDYQITGEITLLYRELEHFCEKYVALYQKDKIEDLLSENRVFFENWIKEASKELKEIDLEEIHLQSDIIRESFASIFRKQYIKYGSNNAKIKLVIGEIESCIELTRSECTLTKPIRSESGIYFVESPKLFDEIGSFLLWGSEQATLKEMMIPNCFSTLNVRRRIIDGFKYMKQYSTENESPDLPDNVDEVLKMLRETMNGQADYYTKEGIKFKDKQYDTTFYTQNVSTGVKSVALLEYAVRIGAIQKNDILILDEPEINLHPEWQLIYAKVLVKLQKMYDLTLLVTTHSPYFLRAIECFCDLDNLMDKLNVYSVCRDSKQEHIIEDVMESEYGMSKLYEILSSPFERLEEEIEEKYGLSTEGE